MPGSVLETCFTLQALQCLQGRKDRQALFSESSQRCGYGSGLCLGPGLPSPLQRRALLSEATTHICSFLSRVLFSSLLILVSSPLPQRGLPSLGGAQGQLEADVPGPHQPRQPPVAHTDPHHFVRQDAQAALLRRNLSGTAQPLPSLAPPSQATQPLDGPLPQRI